MSIQISQLSKSIGQRTILQHIDLDLRPGEVVGLLGPNGAGKTTLMRIITGALAYKQGSVKVCGMEVAENQVLCAAKIGYLPENNPLYDDMYIREYLAFMAQVHGMGAQAKPRVAHLLEQLGLNGQIGKKLGELSKGTRQRVGLAQALLHDPEVLILDEPTTGLDPNQLAELHQLISELGHNRTVLLSTHILQEVQAICTRAVLLHEGQIVADVHDMDSLSPDAETAGQTLRVETLSALDIDDLRRAVPGITEMTAQPSANVWRLHATRDIRVELFRYAAAHNNPILVLQPLTRTIEDVFRQATAPS